MDCRDRAASFFAHRFSAGLESDGERYVVDASREVGISLEHAPNFSPAASFVTEGRRSFHSDLDVWWSIFAVCG